LCLEQKKAEVASLLVLAWEVGLDSDQECRDEDPVLLLTEPSLRIEINAWNQSSPWELEY
jgi:hypothetical protein